MLLRKITPPKALAIRINLVFLAFFLILYSILLLCPPDEQQAASRPRCSSSFCQGHKVENGIKMEKLVLHEPNSNNKEIKNEKPSFLSRGAMGRGLMKIGMINMEEDDVSEWTTNREIINVSFDKVSDSFEWKDLFPEWIDEEEEIDGPSCPEIPMPDFNQYGHVDMVVAKLPCRLPEEGLQRDVFRLQVHLVAANLAVRRGKLDRDGKMKVVFLSKCSPMVELFRCNELVTREGEWWLYRPELVKLQQKVNLPVGSCDLAMPLWAKETNEVFDVSNIHGASPENRAKREAYATVLHSSETYVCGAITLAQTLLQTRTRKDLLLLLDTSISKPKRDALTRAGWKLRFIKRIRNPRSEKNSYNEYNYSKFRLWQLTDYDKIIFIDSDIIVLRNLDALFRFPQMSATGNDGSIFNSGVMVIEPSNCTFRMLMNRRKEIVSYNGGDQGFLNEVFVWWHRLPRRVNFLKNFWSNSSNEAAVKNQLFGSDPPAVYSIHFLGLKPWLCYRDYDCNWDIPDQWVYASDVAHARWWRVHDAMDEGLKGFCGLTEQRKIELESERKNAEKLGLMHQGWRINVTDPRKFI